MRIGHGYDVHRLAEGRKLILGGVHIYHSKGLLGHSDADVLTHAIMDSLLGSLALGDIGQLFPDTDPRYKGADSISLLRQVVKLIEQKGFRIVNIDATVCAQKPKLAPHIKHMRFNIARACGIDMSQVSIKATTEEGLGFTGNLEGISATAVCLVNERNFGFFGAFSGSVPFLR
ncbi:MAG: 2-C-methyl-D-erythritol 2,4-cyclodiphosphate synthase [Ruminococcus sp.]|nr:2-C-methyl-D-erythritol 2,4-cyclodiphosphate synthase [Ruminococcus sp.]